MLMDAVQASHHKEEHSLFCEKYPFIKELGKGSYGSVFLSKNSQDQLVAVKQYAITDQAFINVLGEAGISTDEFVHLLAQKELQIGQIADHPNIVKVREVYFEHSTAYIVMDYVEGHTFCYSKKYPLESRLIFMQQLLSAFEHLLLNNIIIDDLWSDNIIISQNETCLILIDLGGYEFIDDDAQMPIGHYLRMIEHMLAQMGGGAKVDQCRHLISEELRQETISSAHIPVLIAWIGAMQKELCFLL
jgi:serine/threonine protein kinase